MIVILDSDDPDVVKSIEKELDSIDIKHYTITNCSSSIMKCKAANEIYRSNLGEQIILISLEISRKRNWDIFISPTSCSNSKKLASLIFHETTNNNIMIDHKRYLTNGLTILTKTAMPSVQIKSSFFNETRETVSNIIINSITNYFGITYDK